MPKSLKIVLGTGGFFLACILIQWVHFLIQNRPSAASDSAVMAATDGVRATGSGGNEAQLRAFYSLLVRQSSWGDEFVIVQPFGMFAHDLPPAIQQGRPYLAGYLGPRRREPSQLNLNLRLREISGVGVNLQHVKIFVRGGDTRRGCLANSGACESWHIEGDLSIRIEPFGTAKYDEEYAAPSPQVAACYVYFWGHDFQGRETTFTYDLPIS
jgi:hypothetical protein